MFNDEVSDKAKFWIYFTILLMTGFILFVLGATIYPPLKDMAVALNSKENPPIFVWLCSGAVAFLLGSFWLCFYIFFESAKKGIVDLIYKK